MKNVIEKFYEAFENLDADGMTNCYHEDIRFEDPAFGVLKGEKAKNMWRMLCGGQKGKDFTVQVSGIECDMQKGKAHWEAFYTFSKTGRKIHNVVDAEFKIRDGKIIEHRDRFDLYRWSRQALGASGYAIGWTGFFRKKLQAQTNRLLQEFESK